MEKVVQIKLFNLNLPVTFNFSHARKEIATLDDFRILPFPFSGGRMAEQWSDGGRRIKTHKID